jgi:hypothetical protein
MAQIILTDEQIRVIQQASGTVMVRDPDGNAYTPLKLELTAEQIAEMKRRAASPGPWFSSEQVQRRLKSLEAEWERTGGFDEAYLREFLAKLNEDDPGHFRSQGQAG